jgi:hypothetical protein
MAVILYANLGISSIEVNKACRRLCVASMSRAHQ